MITSLNLPKDGFMRTAEDRESYGAEDDDEYSEYLQHFEDQQNLAKRLMGGNYNHNQRGKDEGMVNRGDFLFVAGGGREKNRNSAGQTNMRLENAYEEANESFNHIIREFRGYGVTFGDDNKLNVSLRKIPRGEVTQLINDLKLACVDFISLEGYSKDGDLLMGSSARWGNYSQMKDKLTKLSGLMLSTIKANTETEGDYIFVHPETPSNPKMIEQMSTKDFRLKVIKKKQKVDPLDNVGVPLQAAAAPTIPSSTPSPSSSPSPYNIPASPPSFIFQPPPLSPPPPPPQIQPGVAAQAAAAAIQNASDGPQAAAAAGLQAMQAADNADRINFNQYPAYQLFQKLGTSDFKRVYSAIMGDKRMDLAELKVKNQHEINKLKEELSKASKENAKEKNNAELELKKMIEQGKYLQGNEKIKKDHEIALKRLELETATKKAQEDYRTKELELRRKIEEQRAIDNAAKVVRENFVQERKWNADMAAQQRREWFENARWTNEQDDRNHKRLREQEELIHQRQQEYQKSMNDYLKGQRTQWFEDQRWFNEQEDRANKRQQDEQRAAREEIQNFRRDWFEDQRWLNEQEDRERKIAEEEEKKKREEAERVRKMMNDNLEYVLKNARENRDKGFWAQRGEGDLYNALDKAASWDPLSNPLNKNLKRMENRLEQTVPPYDLPKNYPIYGGNYGGMPQQVNSIPYSMYARQGRTGRRTNMEKFGVPSVRMYQRMKKIGMVGQGGYPMGGPGYPPPQPITDYYEPTQQAYTGYNDGDVSYMNMVNRVAKGLLFGPQRQVTTGNQIVSAYLPNSESSIPRMAYMASKGLNAITPEGMSNADRMELMSNRLKLQEMISKLPDDANGVTTKADLQTMANGMNVLPESGLSKGLRYASKGLALGLTGLGVAAENFWPIHDAYHRYKTMSTIGRTIGNAGDAVLRLLPIGNGYKKRRKNKKRSKVRYGGMIIPPKSLKKMFENQKCDCKK